MKEISSFFDFKNFKAVIIVCLSLVFLISVPAAAVEIISLPIDKKEEEVYQIEAEIPILMELNHKNIQEEYNDLFRDNILTFIEYTIEMARQNQQDFADANFPLKEFVARVDYDLKNDNQILSIKFNYYQYTGGAHGNPYSLSYNIDLATGEDIKLVDFLEDKNLTLSQVEDLIKSKIENEPDLYFQDDYGFQSLDEEQCYYLENGELVVYFQPYAIAPYSTGMPEFRIEY
ncbi:MAG: DUF3298 and DUF4163 domain-containing protein [Halanaerobium sp.]